MVLPANCKHEKHHSVFFTLSSEISILQIFLKYHGDFEAISPTFLGTVDVLPTVSYHRHETIFFFFWHTHRCQATGAFTYCCTAANQTDDEEKSSDSYDYNSWNQRVHIFKEVVIVIICDKHISSYVA